MRATNNPLGYVKGTIAIALLVGMAAFSAINTHASDVNTEPVGFTQLQLQTNSDTYFSIPFTRVAQYLGLVGPAGAVGATLNVSNLPNFAVKQWVSGTNNLDGTVSNTYYVVITSGTKAGAYYTITNNDANNLYVQLAPEDMSGVAAGDSLRIIPYWTLNTAWPGGTGVVASANTAQRKSQILFPAINGVGNNLAVTQTFFYLQQSTATNWCVVGGLTTNYNGQIILPDQYLIVRQPVGVQTTTNVAPGAVPLYNIRIPEYTLTTKAQDNYIAIYRPAPVSLNDSGLSNGWAHSANTAQRKDLLLEFNNKDQRVNKAATNTYFMVAAVGNPVTNSGWRLVGSTPGSLDVGTNLVFTPGTGYIIRKYQTNAVPSTIMWANSANYTN